MRPDRQHCASHAEPAGILQCMMDAVQLSFGTYRSSTPSCARSFNLRAPWGGTSMHATASAQRGLCMHQGAA